MNAMSGSVPAQAELNWQMTGLFLLALVLLGFVMKLVALLLPVTGSQERSLPFWLLLSPHSRRRLRPVGELCPTLFGSVRLRRTPAACEGGWPDWSRLHLFGAAFCRRT